MAAVPEAELAGPLFEQYEPGLYRFCLSRLRSREDAEDAVQATFLRATRALQRGVRPDVAPAWLFTIARNVCSSRRLAALRRARVETPRDLDGVPASALAREDSYPEELVGLRGALAEMPPQLRRVVLLREWQGLSYREIGAELGVSQAAVETLLFRARRDLARRLRGLLDLGPLFSLKALLGGATVAAVAVATVHPARVAPSVVRAVEAPPAAVPHPMTLPIVTHVVRAARPKPVVHVRHVAPPPRVVPAVPAPVAAPRPVAAGHHATRPAEPDVLPPPSVVPPPPAAAPAPAPAPDVAPAPEPAAPPPASPPAQSAPPPAPEPAVPVPAPVAAAVQQPADDVENTAASVDSTVSSAVPAVSAVPPVPSTSTVLGG